MTGLPVPVLASEVPGNFITSALWTANVYNGVGFLLNRPVCALYQVTAQSVANATLTAVSFDGSTLDPYASHNNTTNPSRFTAPVAGWYLVFGSVMYATNGTGFRTAAITKNGTGNTVNGGFSGGPASSGYYTSSSVLVPVSLAAGDYIELGAYHTAGAALSTAVGSGQCSSMTVWWWHA